MRDKFLYHRTVIVTAGVHRRLVSELSPRALTFRHWPGVSSYTSSCEFAGTYVFVKQSPGVVRCGRCLATSSALIANVRTLFCRVP